MKKRILSLLCVLCLMLTMLPTSAFAAGYDAPTLSIDASYLAETNQVKMSVKIGAYTDLGALDFHVKYDKEKLKVNGTPTKGGLLTANSTVSDNNSWNPATIGVVWADENGSTTTTTTEILTVIFDVIEGKTGAVDFSFDEAKYNFCDKSGDNSTDAPGAGSVTSANATIPKAPISSVTASVETPEAGKKLDFTGTVDSSAPYSITKVEWFEGTGASGSALPNPTTAGAKKYYSVRITLTANPGETFAASLDNTISGIYSVTRNSETELYLTKAYHLTGDLPAASVTAAPTAKSGLKYDGTKKDLLGFVGTADGGTMQYRLGDSGEFTTAIPMATDAGTYTVYYKAKGDSGHSDSAVASISAKIDPKDISGVTIGTITDQSYTGSAITPDPEVKDGTTKLEKGTDYTVSCTDIYVGNATLTITGKSNYTGTKTANFTITAVDQNPSFDTPASLVKGGHRLDLRTLVRDAKGTVIFTISGGTSTHAELESDGYTLTSTGIPGTVNINVRIAAQNEGGDSAPEYNEFIQIDAITVNVVDKTPASLTVTQADTTYGTALADPVYDTNDMIASSLKVTYKGRGTTSYTENTAKPTDAGTYTVKVTYETATKILSGSADFTIEPKSISDVTVTLDKTSLEYNGNTQTVTVTVKDGASTLTKDTDYTVTGATSGTNVSSYTVTVNGKGNYTNSVEKTWKITAKDVTVTGITATDRAYAKDNLEVALTGGTLSGVFTGDTVTVDLTNAKGTMTDANAGNGKAVTVTGVVLGGADKGNYKLKAQPTGVTVNINKATAPTLENITVNQKYNVTTGEKAIGAVMPDDAGTLTYAKGTTESTTGSVTIDSWNVDTTTGKVTYTLSGGKANDTVTLPVTIKSTNYADSTVNVVITLIKGSSGGYYYAPTAAVVPDMPMLYRGCTGDAVKTLQDKLNALGYNSGNVDGIFGAKTYAAVTAFQKANSLGVDGIVGKLTWGKLYGVSPAMPVETTTVVGRPMVSYGSRGDAVRKLQELLNALGYDCGSVDGIFGSKTKAAVLAFQKANGLGVDGIVGPLTWAKLG